MPQGNTGKSLLPTLGRSTRYKGRNSLDDVGRVYHIPKWKIDAVKDKLLEELKVTTRAKTLEDTYNSFEDISVLASETPELLYAAKLEETYGVSEFTLRDGYLCCPAQRGLCNLRARNW